jgi:hypothetical protein
MTHLPETTQTLLAAVPEHRAKTMVRRTWQGGTLILFAMSMVFGTFTLLIVMVLKDVELSKWVMIVMGLSVVLGVILGIIGATFWSTQVVSAAAHDIGTMSRDLLPFKRNKEKA